MATTDFDPAVHGFPFANNFGKIPPFGVLGFCGGMCFSALDHFYARDPIPRDLQRPPAGDRLFLHLWRRQMNTLTGGMWWDTYVWQRLPDHDGPGGKRGIGSRTAEEWEKVRREIDMGRPQVLCLIRTSGTLGKVWVNHQVVAYAYDFDAATKRAEMQVYDPNIPSAYVPKNGRPGRGVKITLDLSDPARGVASAQEPGPQLRGFFVVDYDRKGPVM